MIQTITRYCVLILDGWSQRDKLLILDMVKLYDGDVRLLVGLLGATGGRGVDLAVGLQDESPEVMSAFEDARFHVKPRI